LTGLFVGDKNEVIEIRQYYSGFIFIASSIAVKIPSFSETSKRQTVKEPGGAFPGVPPWLVIRYSIPESG
jgi:hypothetical protein